MDKTSGFGLPLAGVYDALYGTSKSAKAFRSLLKDSIKGTWDDAKAAPLLPLAVTAIRALASSHDFLQRWKNNGVWNGGTFKWDSINNPKEFFAADNWRFDGMKKWMEQELGTTSPRLSADTSKFLLEWANTNGGRLPKPQPDIVHELLPYRPTTTRLYYRGYRFNDVGELVAFHEKYAAGKAFPFESDRFSPWTTDKEVAGRFARYRAASSQNDAMFGFFARAKSGKDYDGNGGYVMGARIAPDQCLVDMNHAALPFGGGQHGNEGEVVVLPNTPLVAKIYSVFGNLNREVEEFLNNKYRTVKTPHNPDFFGYTGGLTIDVDGDEESGEVKLGIEPGWSTEDENPKDILKSRGKNILLNFRENLYHAEWVKDDTIRYWKMKLPTRVAVRFLNM